ncbi:hypothetical protein LXL04_007066 [Taraxacum kok-saghyz]
MYDSDSPSSYFVAFVLLILIKVPTFICTTDARYKSCGIAFECGTLRSMKYPFWGKDRPNYCGKLAYKLECVNDTIPVIEIKSLKYRVFGVNYHDQTITVTRLDYWREICPSRLVNTILDFESFNYTIGTRNLTLGYGCQLPTSHASVLEYPCTINNTKTNVVYAPDFPCNQSVTLPVFENSASDLDLNRTDLVSALDNGFALQWYVEGEQCMNCIQSGGSCGIDPNSHFICYCSDRPYEDICGKPSDMQTEAAKVLTPEANLNPDQTIITLRRFFPLLTCFTDVIKTVFGLRTYLSRTLLIKSFLSSKKGSTPTTMKRRSDPSPSRLSFPVILAIVVCFPAISCQQSRPFDVCGESVECGELRLEYPFWGLTRPVYCGHPAFQLTCQSNVPVFNYESVNYRVLDTDATTQTMIIARNDLWNTFCPQNLYNTTYNSTLFNGDNFGQRNVSLYYNCSSSIPGVQLGPNRFSCNVNESQSDGYFLIRTDLTANVPNFLCESYIDVPVNQTSAGILGAGSATTDDLRSALTAGFNLRWAANDDECSRCIRSDGQCGSNSDLFTCYCATGNFSLTCDNSNGDGGGSSKKSVTTVLPIVGAIIVAIVIGIGIFICRQRRKRNAIKELSPAQTETKAIMSVSSHQLKSDTSTFTASIPSYPSSKSSKDFGKSSYFGTQVFSNEELEIATDNFNNSRELGDGGFGAVYYGKLIDGREVAVKRLYENNFKRVEQFMNEVEILTKLNHENLVKLYGCTSKRSKELLLVYEYIPNGTVADHLHGKLSNSNPNLLSWPVRLNIAIQTAEALAYLHKSDIIHRDVKTNNILLDKSFKVKVADFGLSRLFPNDATHVSTAPQGTPGYVDPEYYQCYQLTDKSDVYSFGVVLIELLSSLQAVDTSRHRLDINLANMAVVKIQNRLLGELVDKSVGFESDGVVRRMMTLVAELAFRCLQQEKDMRPTMKEVVEVLRGIRDGLLNWEKPEVVDIVVEDGET